MKLTRALVLGLALSVGCLGQASPSCELKAGALPRPKAAPGTRDESNPIGHVVVIMQENHSFDNYFGSLSDPRFYGKEVDGIQPAAVNFDSRGNPVHPHEEANVCVADPKHGWDAVHQDWNGGKLDGFVKTNDHDGTGSRVMGYYTDRDLPFYYALANQFAIGDRYFCSTLSQTFPNRFFLMAGTAFGHIKNDIPTSKTEFARRTIYDVLTENKISWKYYSDGFGYIKLFQPSYLGNLSHVGKIADYQSDLASGNLPEVVFLDASFDGHDEHPDADVQIGQSWVASQVRALVSSSAWKSSVLFLTYDENGGFYDHVAPPEACAPDSIAPMLGSSNEPGDYARYGFRVPFVAVSPYAKHHYVSHRVFDHTSILKFIESKFNLPALSARDANADPFSDVFDYSHPVFDVSALPSGDPDPARTCGRRAPELVIPKEASLRSTLSGFCVDVGSGTPLFAPCNPFSRTQRFLFQEDRFHTTQLKNTGTGLCLTAEFGLGEVRMSPCAIDEDQGFEVQAAEAVAGAVQISGWHGDFCFTGGYSGSSLGLSSCQKEDRTDFQLVQ